MSIVDRYAGYLDGIEEDYQDKMIGSPKVTHNNFVHWCNHIKELKNRYVIGLNIQGMEDRPKKDMRRILGSFASDCRTILAYAEDKDKELTD